MIVISKGRNRLGQRIAKSKNREMKREERKAEDGKPNMWHSDCRAVILLYPFRSCLCLLWILPALDFAIPRVRWMDEWRPPLDSFRRRSRARNEGNAAAFEFQTGPAGDGADLLHAMSCRIWSRNEQRVSDQATGPGISDAGRFPPSDAARVFAGFARLRPRRCVIESLRTASPRSPVCRPELMNIRPSAGCGVGPAVSSRHGLRLDAHDMARLRHWPAGLMGQSFWKRDDAGPTLGAPPAPIELPPPIASEFETAARLATGRDPDFLARLLAALAIAARDGRTLVVIERPERLGDLIALLTLAFPEVLRAVLTFSTYHDRPEELTGYRLQGAVPDPRRSRQALDARVRGRLEHRDDRPAG